MLESAGLPMEQSFKADFHSAKAGTAQTRTGISTTTLSTSTLFQQLSHLNKQADQELKAAPDLETNLVPETEEPQKEAQRPNKAHPAEDPATQASHSSVALSHPYLKSVSTQSKAKQDTFTQTQAQPHTPATKSRLCSYPSHDMISPCEQP